MSNSSKNAKSRYCPYSMSHGVTAGFYCYSDECMAWVEKSISYRGVDGEEKVYVYGYCALIEAANSQIPPNY